MSRDSKYRQNQVKQLLKHYLRMGLEAKGYKWEHDNISEVDFIVELLFEEIHECAAAVDERRERLAI